MKRLKLLLHMLFFGRGWDNTCSDCDWFAQPREEEEYRWGFCEYFDIEVAVECDFECVGECRGKKRWSLEKVRATRCDDCKACENSLWGKLKYIMGR